MDVRWEKNEYEEDVKITTLPNGAEIRELVSKNSLPTPEPPPNEFKEIKAMLSEIKTMLQTLMDAHENPKPSSESGGI